MFLRKFRRRKDRKAHCYWALMESVRVGATVRQRIVAYLGDVADENVNGYRGMLEREIEQIRRCHEMVGMIERELGETTLKPLEGHLPPRETAEFKPVGVFELDGGDHVTMVRSSDGFYLFDLREAYPEPNITRREFAELIQPMLVSALGGAPMRSAGACAA